MNMQEATARLGQIIKKLGGGTSVGDQRELEALHSEMQDSAGKSAPKQRPRKQRATAVARAPRPAEPPAAAKKATAKKAKGK